MAVGRRAISSGEFPHRAGGTSPGQFFEEVATAGREIHMNHHDAEITDVVIVLEDKSSCSIDESITRLKALGLEVVDVNVDECVIEGSIDTAQVGELKKVPGVSYVRSVF